MSLPLNQFLAILDICNANGDLGVDRCPFDCLVIPGMEGRVVDRFVLVGFLRQQSKTGLVKPSKMLI
jgi:hypothetical protein